MHVINLGILKSIKKRCSAKMFYKATHFGGLLPKTSYLILNKTIYNEILTLERDGTNVVQLQPST